MLKKSLIMLSLVSSLVMASKEEFVGSGKGYNGDIKVKVPVENKKITDIEVVKHEESGFTRKIGRASCRERVCQNVEIQGVPVTLIYTNI